MAKKNNPIAIHNFDAMWEGRLLHHLVGNKRNGFCLRWVVLRTIAEHGGDIHLDQVVSAIYTKKHGFGASYGAVASHVRNLEALGIVGAYWQGTRKYPFVKREALTPAIAAFLGVQETINKSEVKEVAKPVTLYRLKKLDR